MRSWRAGLPVITRDRIASRDAAASRFSVTSGYMSASWVSSQTEPVHTPWAPSAMRRGHLPAVGDAAGGEHRDVGRRTASTTWGTSTIVEISPQWPPASVPWATITSTPIATWRSACCLAPDERADEQAGVVGLVDARTSAAGRAR